MFPSAACTWRYPTKNCAEGRLPGKLRSLPGVAGTGSFTITCCRPTKALTLISWWVAAERKCRGTIIRPMNLIQFELPDGSRRVGVVQGETVTEVSNATSARDIALKAIESGRSLTGQIQAARAGAEHEFASLLAELRVLPPIDHPDPAHCLVTGTGLTHLGSAATRDKLHKQATQAEEALTDSM